MADDPDQKPKVQLASVELEPRQHRTRGQDNLWDIVGYVNFTEADIETSMGFLRFSINRAIFRLDFDGCEIPMSAAGYRRRVAEERNAKFNEKSETDGKTRSRFAGKLGFGLSRGVNASADAEGELSKDKKTKQIIEQEFSEIRHLVSFSKREEGTKSMEWIIENVDPENGLLGAVIDERDSQGGLLGTLKSPKKGGWSIKPSVKFEPYAEIVDKQTLTIAGNAKQLAAQAANQSKRSRKLGVISALLGKEIEHVDLSPRIMPEEEDD